LSNSKDDAAASSDGADDVGSNPDSNDSSPLDSGFDATPGKIFADECPPGTTYTDTFAADPVLSGNWLLLSNSYTYNPDHTVSLPAGGGALANTSALWIGPRPNWTNYTVTVVVRPDTAMIDEGVNLRMEYSPPYPAGDNMGQMYYAGILQSSVQSGNSSAGTWYQGPVASAAPFSLGTFYTIVATIRGSTLTVSVNGAQYITTPAPSLAYGSIGLRSWQSGATYSSVSVTCQ
jgi:hypothetical protein